MDSKEYSAHVVEQLTQLRDLVILIERGGKDTPDVLYKVAAEKAAAMSAYIEQWRAIAAPAAVQVPAEYAQWLDGKTAEEAADKKPAATPHDEEDVLPFIELPQEEEPAHERLVEEEPAAAGEVVERDPESVDECVENFPTDATAGDEVAHIFVDDPEEIDVADDDTPVVDFPDDTEWGEATVADDEEEEEEEPDEEPEEEPDEEPEEVEASQRKSMPPCIPEDDEEEEDEPVIVVGDDEDGDQVVYLDDDDEEEENDDALADDDEEAEEQRRMYNMGEPFDDEPGDGRTVGEMMSVRRAKELRRAMSLNDSFRFRRELFGNSHVQMSETLALIDAMADYDEAQEYLIGKLGWDAGDEVVKEFMALVEKHFK